MSKIIITILLLTLILSACEAPVPQSEKDAVEVSVWAHAGQALERKTIEHQLQLFDSLHDDINVKLTFIPERTYNAQLQAAAIAGDLPDLVEFDAPYLANYVWQGHLQPLDNLLSMSLQKDLLPSIINQGRYQGHLYAVGTFDSGLALYARRSLLQQINARIPQHPGQAWTIQEFVHILNQLSLRDEDKAVLDLKLNYPDEWFSYGFSPLLQSAGGDLIDRSDYQKANGVINGQASEFAMRHVQNWIDNAWVDPNLDDAAFVNGRVALSWAGHWEYQRYHQAFRDDLVLLPLPDMEKGSRTGQGSWVWGISKQSRCAQQAAKLIEFLFKPEQVMAITKANGAVPATRTAINQSALYKPGGPLHLYVTQLAEGYSIPRPATPAYPVISSSFRQAFTDIRDGVKVKKALDRAAQKIDEDIHDNQGYPKVSP